MLFLSERFCIVATFHLPRNDHHVSLKAYLKPLFFLFAFVSSHVGHFHTMDGPEIAASDSESGRLMSLISKNAKNGASARRYQTSDKVTIR